MAKKLRSQLNHETKKGSSVSSVSCNPAAGGTATTARRQREATVAAVKFPPAGQAASEERASEPPNKLNTHIHAHAGGHRAGSHARTHTALAQPGNIFRCSFTCTGAASLCDDRDRDRRGAGGRHRSARQLFHSSLSFLPASASVVSRQQHPHPPGDRQPTSVPFT